MGKLDSFQERLGYTFTDPGLLRLALTHPSVSHETPGSIQHNQRLEFLGDSVLGLVLTRELYEKYPGLGEGPLTKARAQMVNRKTLANQARRLDIGSVLILSHGEEVSGGRSRISSLADAFESLLGAVFLDGGYEAAQRVILDCFQDSFGDEAGAPNLENPKGELQELLQADSPKAPEYELAAVSGPDHDRVFECAVCHGGVELGRGTGKSKKAAESRAAAAALTRVRETTEQKKTTPDMKTVAVIGASANPEKFGNRAVRSFLSKGFKVFPVNPREEVIESLPVYKSILDVPEPLNMISVYLPPDRVLTLLDDIASKGCDELWLNPGSESEEAVEKALSLGLNPIVACSIVGT